MRAKVEEQKKLLEHYEEKGYLYDRHAQDLKSHTAALVRVYDENVHENIKKATVHRQMAQEQAQHEFADCGTPFVNAARKCEPLNSN
ncbi:MAG: hypothetical protein H0X43_12885 [Nitrosospira sp.]|nr:hypothetical protein [Nitrosospira sp.]